MSDATRPVRAQAELVLPRLLATALRKILGSVANGPNVAEVGIGVNPERRRNGDVQEDKKARGLGHVDMVLYRPAVRLDGQVLVDDGRIVALG